MYAGKLLYTGQIDKVMASYIGGCAYYHVITVPNTQCETPIAGTSTSSRSISTGRPRWNSSLKVRWSVGYMRMLPASPRSSPQPVPRLLLRRAPSPFASRRAA